MSGLRTEFDFTLPKGYVDNDGTLHRHGTMRLATARDEIEPLRDRSIDGPDDPYLTILVLARVVTRLGDLPDIDLDEIEGLFAADLAFLQDLYGIINFGDHADVEALQASVLPDDGGPDRVADLSNDPIEAPIDDADDEFGTVVIGEDGSIVDDTVDASDVPPPTPEPATLKRGRRGSIEEVPSSSTATG